MALKKKIYCIKITLKGRTAIFLRVFSNSRSYFVLTPINAKGILAAIMGIDRKDFVLKTNHLKIAIVVKNPVRTQVEAYNYKNLKPGNENMTLPTPTQVLTNVEYDVYIYDPNTPEGISVPNQDTYPTYFGKKKCPANWEFCGYYPIEEIDEVKNVKTNAVIKFNNMKLHGDNNYFIIERNLPISQNINREYDNGEKVIFSKEGMPLNCDLKNVSLVDGQYVNFL